MKISLPYRLIALTLALLTAVSSVGVAANLHYCQGHLYSFALWGKAAVCNDLHGEMQMHNCDHDQQVCNYNDNPQFSKSNCCQNRLSYAHSDQDLEITHCTLNWLNASPIFFNPDHFTSLHLLNNQELEPIFKTNNHAPPLPKDIPILFQSFLL